MSDACPGTCNTAWRAWLASKQDTPEPPRCPGEPVWCPPCASRIRRALADLEYLGCLLDAIADGHHEQPLNPQRVGAYAASPSSAADDLDELKTLLYESEDSYRALKGYAAAPRHGYLASVTTEIVTWLTRHLDGILAAPFAASFGEEILQLHRELMSKTKAGPGKHRKPVPCPRCGLRLLTWDEGDDHVVCGGCNRHMPMAEYQEEAAQAARGLERAG